MTQRVALPDGRPLDFPDGMSQDDMAAAIQKNFPEYAKPSGIIDSAISGIKDLATSARDAWNAPIKASDTPPSTDFADTPADVQAPPILPATKENPREVNPFGYGARMIGSQLAKTGEIANLVALTPAIAVQMTQDWINNDTTHERINSWFDKYTAPFVQAQEYYAKKPNEKLSYTAEVAGAVGSMIADLPLMIASGGEAALAPAIKATGMAATTAWSLLKKTLGHGFDTMRPLMIRSGVEKAEELEKQGATPEQVMRGSLSSALATGLVGAVPMSREGPLVSRLVTGFPTGVGIGELTRNVGNVAMADMPQQQRDFSLREAGISGVTGSVMAGAVPLMGGRSPLTNTRQPELPTRTQLGYDVPAGVGLEAIRPLEKAVTPDPSIIAETTVEGAVAKTKAALDQTNTADKAAEVATVAKMAVPEALKPEAPLPIRDPDAEINQVSDAHNAEQLRFLNAQHGTQFGSIDEAATNGHEVAPFQILRATEADVSGSVPIGQRIISRLVAGAFGKEITYIKDANGQSIADGIYGGSLVGGSENRIFVDINSQYGATRIVGHEIGHALEAQMPGAFAKLRDTLGRDIDASSQADKYLAAYNTEYAKLAGMRDRGEVTAEYFEAAVAATKKDLWDTDPTFHREVISNLISDHLTDWRFWADMATKIGTRSGYQFLDVAAKLTQKAASVIGNKYMAGNKEAKIILDSRDAVLEAMTRYKEMLDNGTVEGAKEGEAKTAANEAELRTPDLKKKDEEVLYRGEQTGNKGGRFYSPDREWARQFTQSGQDHEIKSITLKKSDVFEPKEPIYAGDPDAVDIGIAEARGAGFKAIRLDEGRGQPPSVYMFDKTAPRSQFKKKDATPDDFAPGKVKDILKHDNWTILTAENPNKQKLPDAQNAARMDQLRATLDQRGIKYENVDGKYDNPEKSLIVYGVDDKTALAIGRQFDQESVLTRKGLIYQDGTVNPARGVTEHKTKPENYWTHNPKTGAIFTVDLDFDRRVPLADYEPLHGIQAAHFSMQPREQLSGAHYGTGLKGAEAARLQNAPAEIRNRTHFYASTGEGVFPEYGVGTRAHVNELNNLYDAEVNPRRLDFGNAANDAEMALIKAGYDGYVTRSFGGGKQAAVVRFGADGVPTEHVGGAKEANARLAPVPKAEYRLDQQLRRDLVANKNLPGGEMKGSDWQRLMPQIDSALAKRVDLAGLEADKLYRKEDLPMKAEQQPEPGYEHHDWRAGHLPEGETDLNFKKKDLERTDPFEISPRRPTGARATENSVKEMLQIDYEVMKRNPKVIAKAAELIEHYPNYRSSPGAKTPEQVVERYIKQLQGNLAWLYRAIPAEIRTRAKLWYDGAHTLSKQWADDYGFTHPQVAGVMAALSPQTPWFANISLADRVINAWVHRSEIPWTPEMRAKGADIFSKPEFANDLKAIEGKKLSEISDPYQQAMWVRIRDEAHNDRSHEIYNPEGEPLGVERTDSGAEAQTPWGSLRDIAKALSILQDGSIENLDRQLGDAHKVRSFYNNILVPNSPNEHFTGDTHAVAAATLRPLSSNDREVAHNFGSIYKDKSDRYPGETGPVNDSINGVSGLYGIYAEAYRRAARELGIMPRELQSITWEASRGLYSKAVKRFIDLDHIWADFKKGKVSLENTRQRILEAAGGIDEPSWFRRGVGVDAEKQAAPDETAVADRQLPGRGAEPAAGGAGGADTYAPEVANWKKKDDPPRIANFQGMVLRPPRQNLNVSAASAFADRSFKFLPGVREVSFSDVRLQELVDPDASRVGTLAAAISKNKSIEPVLVARKNDGTQYVAEGQHRAYALQKLGYDTLPARVAVEDAVGFKKKDEWYYSALSKAVDSFPPKIRTGSEMSMWLQANTGKLGVKKEEIEWSGITDYLKMRGKEKVSVDDVRAFLDGNAVQVKDVVLGGGDHAAAVQSARDSLRRDGFSTDEIARMSDRELLKQVPQPKFVRYQLPGGENYTELLITLPPSTELPEGFALKKSAKGYWIVDGPGPLEENQYGSGWTEAEALQAFAAHGHVGKGVFKSSHFDQPNILAHIRMNDRTDAEGKKVLFLEELQSDWGQKGKKEGFISDGKMPEGWSVHESKDGWYVIDNSKTQVGIYGKTREEAIASATNPKGFTGGIPTAPFVTDTKAWTALALKRAIAYAAENGYDKIAWTNGEQQAARYDLSKQIKSIEYEKQDDGTYHVIAIDNRGNSQLGDKYTESQLEDNVGKELTKKIINGEGPLMPGMGRGREYRELSGLDLKVGGEGMKGYYDGIVPQVANDVLRKIGGGKVGEVEMLMRLSDDEVAVENARQQDRNIFRNIDPFRNRKQPGFDITDAMREKVTKEGLPLFKKKDEIPGHQMVETARGFLSGILNSEGVRAVSLMTVPMSTGSRDAQATGQKFMNALRLAQSQWSRIDNYITANYNPEQRKEMWNAADEQNVLMRQGKDTTGKGIDVLPPDQKKVMAQLHGYAKALWNRAVDAGMVEGEGMPFWTPRMAVLIGEDGTFERPGGKGDPRVSSAGEGGNITTTTANLKHAKYLFAEDTEAAMKDALGEGAQLVRDIRVMPLAMARLEKAIAGRELVNQVKAIGQITGKPTISESMEPNFAMIDHPAFTTYKPVDNWVKVSERELLDKNYIVKDGQVVRPDPKTVDGYLPVKGYRVADASLLGAKMDEQGRYPVGAIERNDTIFERHPMYISKDWEGPLKAVMSTRDNWVYRAYMLLKSKAMTAIMVSPMTHNMVIWGRALAYSPSAVFSLKAYFVGNSLSHDEAFLNREVAAGVVPMGGNRSAMMDITDIARGISKPGGWGDPNESWINLGVQKLGNALHLKGDAAKAAMDKFGDWYHHDLLWKQVGALQHYIFNDYSNYLVSKGHPQAAADAIAANLANRYGGAVARENQSSWVRKLMNVILFSRSFNVGNIGAVKDTVFGLPAGLAAKIYADVGKEAGDAAMRAARGKARMALAADLGMSLLLTAVTANAIGYIFQNQSPQDIEDGYVRRFHDMIGNIQEHPFTPDSYTPYRMLPTWDNETGKQERIDLGPDEAGQHTYLRLPSGKVIEDTAGWILHAPTTFIKKLSPVVKSASEALANDKALGRPGYVIPVEDPDSGLLMHLAQGVGHVIAAQVPLDSMKTAWDVMSGNGTDLDKKKLIGFATGFTTSQGSPHGPEAAEVYAAEDRVKQSKAFAMERVKYLIKHGDTDAAIERLEKIGLTNKEIDAIVRNIESPKQGVSKATLKKAIPHMTAEELQRLERAGAR